ncbi:MAG: MFS transporter [Bacteroidetes bacterium GWF2_42_66]|nr:MAG: MFS transporter [Bacteroidetes bacterium GWA2_42_15]OFY02501.1 MAG: MFS transporter [Bacteroidetes bacterium GWE2_42_39]OFY41401.1 MAG: MFS transporter [Bacteroidetes bacterium GWF2_42_66]HBL75395.1 MFS transporter [Prolixibacteraceae bacterium]HCU60696.1 MFS transporter [Prolixibacteraceae bacterium]
MENATKRNPWFWVPSLYYAEGIPYVIVMTLSVIMYKRFGISNTDIALYTSWLYLPWVIKPLWSPLVDLLKTKRFWIVIMQLVIGAGLAGVAFMIPVERFFQYTLAFFWLLAFSSATHDIAADGFYMLGLSSGDQAFFVGIRSTFYRFAMLTGQGLLVILAGALETATGLAPVHVVVNAQNTTTVPIEFNPDEYLSSNEGTGLYFISEEELNVPIAAVGKQETDSIYRLVEKWNIENHFYTEENRASQKDDRSGWWSRLVSQPLKAFLKDKFGQQTVTTGGNFTGNMAIVPVRLSQQPPVGEKVVLNFSFEKGDKSIRLMRNYRYEFTEKNWNKPAFAMVQLDPKLKKPASATFTGRSGNITFAWSVVFIVIAFTFLLFSLYHRFALPRPSDDKPNKTSEGTVFGEFFSTFASFFRKKEIGVALLFILIYRLGESQIVKMAAPFLLDSREAGGMGITTGDLGLVYGTAGMIALTIGGILGGIVASRKGLKYWLWKMAIIMNVPHIAYLLLSWFMPDSLGWITFAVVIEQFGYGFGFTAFMLYMIYISEGQHKTAYYAIGTGFMALGMMLPGMLSGWLQEIIGYQNFFIWVMICSVPPFLIIPFLKVDREFGIKKKEEQS